MIFLLTGSFKYSEEQINLFVSKGHKIYYSPREDKINCNIDLKVIDCVICSNNFFVYNDITKMKNLKIIQLLGVGVDRIPLNYIKSQNIKLYNAEGSFNVPIAEFVIGQILSLYKDIAQFKANQKEHLWVKNRNLLELEGQKICIVGAGNIGGEIAKKLSVFTDQIYGVSRHTIPTPYFLEIMTLERFMQSIMNFDIIISALSLDDSTYHIFNLDFFQSMKRGSLFVNIGRGKLVCEKDLIYVLKLNHLMGAILDVFESEPIPYESNIWDIPNLIITPHNAYASVNNRIRLWKLIERNFNLGGL